MIQTSLLIRLSVVWPAAVNRHWPGRGWDSPSNSVCGQADCSFTSPWARGRFRLRKGFHGGCHRRHGQLA